MDSDFEIAGLSYDDFRGSSPRSIKIQCVIF